MAKTPAKAKTRKRPPGFHCPIISVRDAKAPAIAARVMAKGGVIAYPTETSYALGCNALDAEAVLRVYSIKGRKRSKPLPVIMASASMVRKFTVPSAAQNALVKRFMPGPLTIAARKRVEIAASGKARTVAFRIPKSAFARKASALLGAPIVSTSANVSGKGAIFEVARIVKMFAAKADLIVDAGDLPYSPPSTIVCLAGAPKILREGPVRGKGVLAEISAKSAGRKAKGKGRKK
jgi:L-threonylcarbamoyladenylate synthase